MNRSNFLALIPSLSAIPLIANRIVQKSDKIEIYQPEQIKDYVKPTPNNTCIAVINNDIIVGTAFLTNVHFKTETIETTCSDNNGARSYQPGQQHVTIEAEMYGPINDKMIDALHYAMINRYQS